MFSGIKELFRQCHLEEARQWLVRLDRRFPFGLPRTCDAQCCEQQEKQVSLPDD
ncbi:MAG: hypothetical protein WA117_18270 [Verrucomicrobiia bacterium]